ncbi:MAG: cell division protein FtsQ/DivIB [Synechococcaceae cyanobacterium]|jgi:cell division protein FtsQ
MRTVSGPLPPGAARRREVRQQRQAERLRNLWRFFVFSALAAGLGTVLLRQGWMLRDPSQLEVRGSALVNREQVIQAAGIRFPQPLLSLRPRQLSRSLVEALPVEQVKVTRLMLPPRLRIELVDREAVARASRRSAGAVERGYVDRLGNWIPVHPGVGVRLRGAARLEVAGWNSRHRAELAKVLEAAPRFGPGLREIRFEPDGSLWLTTSELGRLRLGPGDARLPRRLEVAEHLIRTLPTQIRGRRPQMIDLSDPEQPELSLPGPVGAAPRDGRNAPPPRGGQ